LLAEVEPGVMTRPSLEEARALSGHRVRVVVPKPREDQRLVGTIEADDDGVRLRVDGGDAADGGRFGTVQLRERDRDAVLQAYRDDDTLVGRVEQLSKLGEQ
jgi:hypothetical protein